MYLSQIGGELCLLICPLATSRCGVAVSRHGLGWRSPGSRLRYRRFWAARCAHVRRSVDAPAPSSSSRSQQPTAPRPRSRDGGRIERAIRVVTGEGLLMRPCVATQFAQQAALGCAERPAENVVPGSHISHNGLRHRLRERASGIQRSSPLKRVASTAARFFQRLSNSRSTKAAASLFGSSSPLPTRS